MADRASTAAHRHPTLLILCGTVVLGISGLFVLAAVAAVLDAADYAVFGAFWSALFFVVAILSGGQQESTRAVATGRTGPTPLVAFAGLLALAAVLVVLGSSPLWAHLAFGDGHVLLVVVVALGCAGYVINGVLAGLLAGSAHWPAYAALLAVEGVVRAGLVLLALVARPDVSAIGWAVVITYPIASLFIGVPLWRKLRPHRHIAEPLRALSVRTVQTMAAAAGVATLVNGFPLLMSVASRGSPAQELGAMTLAVMLTRAPLLVPLMALQSFLITSFAKNVSWRTIGRLIGAAIVGAALLGALAALIGPPLLDRVFGADFVVEGHVLALLVLSSGGLGAMCMVSPAVIVQGEQVSNAAGWMLAAAVSVLILAVAPGGIDIRAAVALLVGPAVGLVFLLVVLARSMARASKQG